MDRVRGFTLIELMVVIAIVGIIAAIALPSFNEQVRKSRRSQAIQGLSQMQLDQEQWRSNHTAYAPENTAASGSPPNGISLPSSDYYTFAVTGSSNTATAYTVTATPKSGSAQYGDRCGTYTFSMSAGVVTKSQSPTASSCGL